MATLVEKWNASRSLPHANAADEQEVKQQVSSVLRLQMDGVADITRNPDILRRIMFSHLSAECMKAILRKLCASLSITQKRPHSFSGMAEGKFGVMFRGRCSRNGSPGASVASFQVGRGGRSPSLKCKCRFKFSLNRDGTLTIRNHSSTQMHAPACQPETQQQTRGNPYLQTQLMSPSKIASAVAECAELRRNDGNFTNGNIMRKLYTTMQPLLPDGMIVTQWLLKKYAIVAKRAANDNIDPQLELEALLKLFHEDPTNFSVSKLELVGNGYDSEAPAVSQGELTFAAVAWIDRRMLPPGDEAITVIQSDVTFGMTNPGSGFDKLDVWCSASMSRGLNVLMMVLIRNESARTFQHNVEFLCTEFPHLKTDEFVMVIDGDPAKILAVRSVCAAVIIVLCLKHLRDNFISRRGSHSCYRRDDDEDEDVVHEGLADTFVCLCRKCGIEMPLPDANDAASAADARCSACAGSSSSSGGSAVALGGSWLHMLAGAAGAAGAAAAAAVSALVGRPESLSDTDVFKRAMESNVMWNTAWSRLRNSSTLPECKTRLDLLKQHYPQIEKYVDFLWRNVGLWAKVAFVWKPTLG